MRMELRAPCFKGQLKVSIEGWGCLRLRSPLNVARVKAARRCPRFEHLVFNAPYAFKQLQLQLHDYAIIPRIQNVISGLVQRVLDAVPLRRCRLAWHKDLFSSLGALIPITAFRFALVSKSSPYRCPSRS